VSEFTVALEQNVKVALTEAGAFLRSDPVQHNLVLTLLDTRAAHPEPGRYAWVRDGAEVTGAIVQSPLVLHAAVTAIPAAATEALVDELVAAWSDLGGVFGPADTVARFAGHWAERLGVAAAPVEGQRLYALDSLDPPVGVAGSLRRAIDADAGLVLKWVRGFLHDTGAPPIIEEAIRRRLDAGLIWIWEHQDPVSMASHTPAVAGVSRIGGVYTPPEHRGHGYATACTAAVTEAALQAGAQQCVLYTQLANPQSNAIYRSLGYKPVSENLRYRFTPRHAPR
jgi:predicted GNAT family acetyltransferase